MGKKGEKKKEKKVRMSVCCEKEGVRRGAWTAEEDKILVDFITQNGHGTWRNLPTLAGLQRCGKSCRLRWTNYLRPDIKRGPFTPEEDNTIIQLHATLGNKWAAIASHLPGRTDNDIKNFWNSHLSKRFINQPSSSANSNNHMICNSSPSTRHMLQWESIRIEAESRLSTKPSRVNAPSASSKGDYFIRLWNSDVGRSFRNANANTVQDVTATNSPASQMSSLTKVEMAGPSNFKKEVEDVVVCSDSSGSCELDDSPDAMLKMLLDFPVGENDMGFL